MSSLLHVHLKLSSFRKVSQIAMSDSSLSKLFLVRNRSRPYLVVFTATCYFTRHLRNKMCSFKFATGLGCVNKRLMLLYINKDRLNRMVCPDCCVLYQGLEGRSLGVKLRVK